MSHHPNANAKQAAQCPGSSESSPVPSTPGRARASSARAAPRDARNDSDATPNRAAINSSPRPDEVASGGSAVAAAPRATSPDPPDDAFAPNTAFRRRDPREGYLQQRWSAETQVRARRPPSLAPHASRTQSVTRGPLNITTSALPARHASPASPTTLPAAPGRGSPASPATPGSSRSARLLVSAFSSVRRFATRSTPELLSFRSGSRTDVCEDEETPLLAQDRGSGRRRRRSSSFSVSGGDDQTFQ
ncbi:hypothetical protein PsYK624_108070 [Phanerochaete sordida]|uniref:Uncharacterized protein n=1 Tax=Phanerochaete sordida TaxID=48140 RepID=A0A9P3GH02_9APHY|nr:hypothetical protein PsYK624_108070 [Phanerochaete sordida]